jgi:AbrB family looped-hinge helix DNA binding protein
MITTVTGKNQITIPAKLANQLGIQPGTRIEWSIGEGNLVVDCQAGVSLFYHGQGRLQAHLLDQADIFGLFVMKFVRL